MSSNNDWAAECPLCESTVLLGDTANVVVEGGEAYHKVCRENEDERVGAAALERSLSDGGPSDASYRAQMIDAGRGHLLS